VQIYIGESSVSLELGESLQELWQEYRVCKWYFDERDTPMVHIFASLMHMDSQNIEHNFSYRLRELCGIALINLLATPMCFESRFLQIGSRTWDAAISVLEHFSSQPWFQRVWIIQEAVLPKTGSIHYGESIFPWEMLASAVGNVITHTPTCCKQIVDEIPRNSARVIRKLVYQTADIVVHRNTLERPSEQDLPFLLRHTRKRQAHDQRDKVYAVLSLFSNWNNVDPIIANYSMNTRQVYTLATLKAIQTSGSTNVLSCPINQRLVNI